MLRVSENPVQHFPQGRSLWDDLGNWWVVRTKPRNEKALARELAQLGIGYYLPLITKRTVRRDNGKVRKSVVCLFPGYISITGPRERKREIFRSGRALGLIEVLNQERFVTEMDNVRRAVGFTHELELRSGLAVGQEVIITSGPLEGVQGIVTNVNRPGKVCINVEMFNQAVIVSVPPEELAPREMDPGIKIKSARALISSC